MAKIINSTVKNIPWQDKPQGCTDPVWRYTENPIIVRTFVKEANSIFNSAVVPYGDGFAGVFRMDDITREQYLVTGFSDDGIHWKLNDEKIKRRAVSALQRLGYRWDDIRSVLEEYTEEDCI